MHKESCKKIDHTLSKFNSRIENVATVFHYLLILVTKILIEVKQISRYMFQNMTLYVVTNIVLVNLMQNIYILRVDIILHKH